MELLSSHPTTRVRSEGVGPRVSAYVAAPSFYFSVDNIPFGLFLALGGGGCGAAPADIAQDWGVGNPGSGEWKRKWDFGKWLLLSLGGVGNGK